MSSLEQSLTQVRARLQRAGAVPIREDNTKARLIEPLLLALGWDVTDWDEVQREYKPRRSDNPVDYALLIDGRPRVLVEAKALGENLDDRRWAEQILGYAGLAGVEWVVLTNGAEFRIYNSHVPVPFERKLMRRIRIADADPSVSEDLSLLSKDQVRQRRMALVWRQEFAASEVQQALERLAAEFNRDSSLVQLLERHVAGVSAEDIRAVLPRLRITFHSPGVDAPQQSSDSVRRGDTLAAPALPVAEPERSPPTKGRAPGAPSSPKTRGRPELPLRELIRAGLVQAPLNLRRVYRGREVLARVEADGTVVVDGRQYDSLSTAAEYGAASVSDKYSKYNGWLFWEFRDTDGRYRPVDVIRQRYLDSRGHGRR
jgi:predicted type IV restriction endonuclease